MRTKARRCCSRCASWASRSPTSPASMPYCDVQQLFDAVIPFGQHRCYWKMPLSRRPRRRGDRPDPRRQRGAALAEHAVARSGTSAAPPLRCGRRDGVRRPVDALDGLDRRDLERPGRGRRQHRLGAGLVGAAAAALAGMAASTSTSPATARTARSCCVGRSAPTTSACGDQAADTTRQHVPLQPEHQPCLTNSPPGRTFPM